MVEKSSADAQKRFFGGTGDLRPHLPCCNKTMIHNPVGGDVLGAPRRGDYFSPIGVVYAFFHEPSRTPIPTRVYKAFGFAGRRGRRPLQEAKQTRYAGDIYLCRARETFFKKFLIKTKIGGLFSKSPPQTYSIQSNLTPRSRP